MWEKLKTRRRRPFLSEVRGKARKRVVNVEINIGHFLVKPNLQYHLVVSETSTYP